MAPAVQNGERRKTRSGFHPSQWISARCLNFLCLPAAPVENASAENFLAGFSEDQVAAQEMLSHLLSEFYLITWQLQCVAVPAF